MSVRASSNTCDRILDNLISDLPHHAMTIGAGAFVARTFTTLSSGVGAVVCAYAELVALAVRVVTRIFTNNEAIVRTATRGARLLGGHFLGTAVAHALTGAAPLAFGPTTFLLTLGSPALLEFAIHTVNDLFSTISGVRIPSRQA